MVSDDFKGKVDAFVDEVWEDLVADIDTLVSYRSVEDLGAAAPGMPWGPACHDALVASLDIAHRLGLDAHECEGYIGYADLVGKSEIQIATIAHSDVVPEGQGWDFPPFQVTRKDGYLLGRGVRDDKGPLVLALYASHFFARQVAETGQALPYTLRCIVGNDEETTMGDLTWYLKHYPMPAFAFSPDADFPLICGEKGLYSGSFTSQEMACGRIVSLEGGTVGNAVAGLASAVVRANLSDLPEAPSIDLEDAGVDEKGAALVRLVAHGRGGHASMPEGTVNAIGLLVAYLLDQDICSQDERVFLELEKTILSTTDGSSLGLATSDDKFGPLTLIGGTVRTEEGPRGVRFVQTVDSRYPTSITGEEITARLTELAGDHACTYQQGRNVTPFYVDPELPAIRCLLDTYEEYSGKPGRAFTIGGGTYARHFARGAAFGPVDADETFPDWVGPEHGPNEGVREEGLKQALKIYIVSIARLMELEL